MLKESSQAISHVLIYSMLDRKEWCWKIIPSSQRPLMTSERMHYWVRSARARSPESRLSGDVEGLAVGDRKFAIGTVETASPATIEKRTPELLSTMQRLAHERGYISFLFMIVDIINMQCRLLVWGGERAVADVLGAPLEPDGHTIIVDGLVSRKKQLVPLLGRIQASM